MGRSPGRNNWRASAAYRRLGRIIWNIFICLNADSWHNSWGEQTSRTDICTTPFNDDAQQNNGGIGSMWGRPSGSDDLLNRPRYGNHPTRGNRRGLGRRSRDRGSPFMSGRARNSNRDRSSGLSWFWSRQTRTSSRVWDVRNNINMFRGYWLKRLTSNINSRSNLWRRFCIYRNRQIRECFQDGRFKTTKHILSGCAARRSLRRWELQNRNLRQQKLGC